MLRVLVTVLFPYSDYDSAVELNITCKECVVKEKAQALWHKQNQKPTTAANITREVGRKQKTPNVKRWNSLYDSMENLSEVTEQAVLDTSEGSSPDEDKDDDFFKAFRNPEPTATEGTNSTRLSNRMGKELES
ncbi:hypothetical protein GWK47_020284 [Chionoecetes opilio]|uniref:Uncharacterized protein n=1 Tax=Chionoecetes opilio TaxID=41210 RepID=A0A8J5BWE5_CHIOP|nr:hypothetical protein GWK47_020284 [Chionoecetes opilio]